MIVIACDDPRLVNRWTRTLRKKYPLYAVSQKTALVRAVSSLKPQILILDSDLPRLRAIRELPAIQGLSPATKTLVISNSPTIKEGVSVLKAGAKGYCGCNISSALLNKAIRVILKEEIWGGRKIASAVIQEMFSNGNCKQLISQTATSFDGLSARKRQIAELVIEGASNRAIATRLNISEATVKAHLTAIFRRLKLSRRFDLALLSRPQSMANGAHPSAGTSIAIPEVG